MLRSDEDLLESLVIFLLKSEDNEDTKRDSEKDSKVSDTSGSENAESIPKRRTC